MYAVVTETSAFLYDCSHSSVVDEVLCSWALEILKGSLADAYLLVRTHYGYEGWIKSCLVKAVSAETLKERDESEKLAVIIKPFSDVLSEPKVQGRIIKTLSRGSYVEVLDAAGNDYEEVQLPDGQHGYVPVSAIGHRQDSDAYIYNKEKDFKTQNGLRLAWENEESFRKAVVETAKAWMGTQYRWGGRSSAGIDCSGLMSMSYMMNGVLIYRDAVVHEDFPVHRIRFEDKKPGDLIFFPGHVAMSIGNGRYIHSTGYKESFGVCVNSFDPRDRLYRPDLAGKVISAGSIFLPAGTA